MNSLLRRALPLGVVICFVLPGFSQNAFLDLFHPKFIENTPLITDSLHIRTEALQRFIRYIDATQDNIPNKDFTEIRKSANGLQISRIQTHSEAFGNGFVVVTETLDSITGIVFKDRQTCFGADLNQPDSIYIEVWADQQWQQVQKTLHAYTNSGLLQFTEYYNWDNGALQWAPMSKVTYNYDNNKRLVLKENLAWKDEAWLPVNRYRYTYQGGFSIPVGQSWYSGEAAALNPVDSTKTWLNLNGQRDSAAVFYWNPGTGAWFETQRQLFQNEVQQKAEAGKTVSIGANGQRTQREEWVYVPGDQTFTDEPAEATLRRYTQETDTWTDIEKYQTTYQTLADGRIYGVTTRNELQDGVWQEIFFAEAWFHKDAGKPDLEAVEDRSRNAFTFTYQCGFSNPYVMNQTVYFPASEAQGDYELKILSEDGRLVYQQRYDASGAGKVSAPLAPGLYVVSVSRGGTPLCTQKLIVQ